ncbi:MAG: alpha/beta fold hydrolase [Betaproteobacteria bacterium]
MWTAIGLWAGAVVALACYGLLAGRLASPAIPLVLWLVALPVFYLAGLMVLCALYSGISWWWRARRPAAVRIGARGTAQLLWDEYRTLIFAAPRMMFYRALVPDPAPSRTEVPVLLVHGVLCNAGIWARMRRQLLRRGVDGVYSLSYGPPLASIETFAAQFAKKLDGVLAATNAVSAVVIGHSMGGLVIRAYLRAHGASKIARVMTIGAPHHGSMHAWMMIGTSLAQLRPGSPWLAALNAVPLDPALRVVSMWSWHDTMVSPQTSSELPGAIDVAIVGVGHNALLGDPAVFERAAAEIAAARADARRAR